MEKTFQKILLLTLLCVSPCRAYEISSRWDVPSDVKKKVNEALETKYLSDVLRLVDKRLVDINLTFGEKKIRTILDIAIKDDWSSSDQIVLVLNGAVRNKHVEEKEKLFNEIGAMTKGEEGAFQKKLKSYMQNLNKLRELYGLGKIKYFDELVNDHIRDDMGNTLLHEAAWWGNAVAAKALVEVWGANVNATNDRRQTPMYRVLHGALFSKEGSSSKDYKEVLMGSLFWNGARVKGSWDTDGRSIGDYIEILEKIEEAGFIVLDEEEVDAYVQKNINAGKQLEKIEELKRAKGTDKEGENKVEIELSDRKRLLKVIKPIKKPKVGTKKYGPLMEETGPDKTRKVLGQMFTNMMIRSPEERKVLLRNVSNAFGKTGELLASGVKTAIVPFVVVGGKIKEGAANFRSNLKEWWKRRVSEPYKEFRKGLAEKISPDDDDDEVELGEQDDDESDEEVIEEK